MINITFKPIIKAYPEYAHLFSIIGNPEENDDYIKWFCQNYIQLRYDASTDVDQALFFEKDVEECSIYRCSLLNKLVFEKQMFSNEKQFCEMVEHYLSKGTYILVILNHYYIPFDERCYMRKHFNHECMVFGIDIYKGIIYIQDFFMGQYTKCEININDFWRAYIHHYDYEIFDDEKIYLFSKRAVKDIARIPFQTQKIKSQYINYLSGERSYFDNRTYGITCYERLIEELHKDKFDLRNYHLLYEHALANTIRLKFLQNYHIVTDINELQEMFDLLCRNALLNRNKLLKWTITGKIQSPQIEDFLNAQRQLEIQAINTLLDRWNECLE